MIGRYLSSKWGEVRVSMALMGKVEVYEQLHRNPPGDTHLKVVVETGVRAQLFDLWWQWDKERQGLLVNLAWPRAYTGTDWSRMSDEIKRARHAVLQLEKTGKGFDLVKLRVEGEPERRVKGARVVVERRKERGVHDLAIEVESPEGGKAQLWYEGEKENSFCFWGIYASMPLVGAEGYRSPTLAIRPRLMPVSVIYWAQSLDRTDKGEWMLFTDGWEVESPVARMEIDPAGHELSFRHRFGVDETVLVDGSYFTETPLAGWELKLTRPRVIGPGKFVNHPIFRETGMRVFVPDLFPKNLVEVAIDEKEMGKEREMAQVLAPAILELDRQVCEVLA